jgi:hypothetical protein
MQTDPEQTPIDHAIQDNTEDIPSSPKAGQSPGSTVDATDTRGEMTHDRPVNKLAASEAAKLLRVTQSAVRKRIQRGTIPWDKETKDVSMSSWIPPMLVSGQERTSQRAPRQDSHRTGCSKPIGTRSNSYYAGSLSERIRF